MNRAINSLKRARTALLAFDAAKAEHHLREFETNLERFGLPEASIDSCAAVLAEIRDLAAAAKEGVAAARQQFQDIVKLSRQLDTYDKSGNLKAALVEQKPTRKF